jgi:hypothetical protein
MGRNPKRFMILVIDFDSHLERLEYARAKGPDGLAERVFILGVLSEPEAFKRATGGSYETIGSAMAKDCREETARLGGTLYSDTMPVNLTVCASTFVPSCSPPFEKPWILSTFR